MASARARLTKIEGVPDERPSRTSSSRSGAPGPPACVKVRTPGTRRMLFSDRPTDRCALGARCRSEIPCCSRWRRATFRRSSTQHLKQERRRSHRGTSTSWPIRLEPGRRRQALASPEMRLLHREGRAEAQEIDNQVPAHRNRVAHDTVALGAPSGARPREAVPASCERNASGTMVSQCREGGCHLVVWNVAYRIPLQHGATSMASQRVLPRERFRADALRAVFEATRAHLNRCRTRT